MTSDDFVTALLGEWEESHLPALLHFVQQWHNDAERYYFIRDFAKKPVFLHNPRERSDLRYFDDIVDAKRHGTSNSHE